MVHQHDCAGCAAIEIRKRVLNERHKDEKRPPQSRHFWDGRTLYAEPHELKREVTRGRSLNTGPSLG